MTPLAIAGLGLLAAPSLGRLARSARLALPDRRGASVEDVLALAQLLALSLTAGLSLPAALAAVAAEIDGPLSLEVDEVIRRSRARGLASVLLEAQGTLAPLWSRLARAQVSGAPMGEAVSSFLLAARSEERRRRLERARTLPIKLVVPLSLLLLPGFLLLVVGPVVLEHVLDLGGSLGRP